MHIKMVKIQIETKSKSNINCWRGYRKEECLFIAGRKAKWHSHLGRQFGCVYKAK